MTTSQGADVGEDRVTQEGVRIIARVRDIDAEKVTLDSSLEDLGIDSMDGINIAFEIEETFDIEIPEEVLREVKSVSEMIEKLRALPGIH